MTFNNSELESISYFLRGYKENYTYMLENPRSNFQGNLLIKIKKEIETIDKILHKIELIKKQEGS